MKNQVQSFLDAVHFLVLDNWYHIIDVSQHFLFVWLIFSWNSDPLLQGTVLLILVHLAAVRGLRAATGLLLVRNWRQRRDTAIRFGWFLIPEKRKLWSSKSDRTEQTHRPRLFQGGLSRVLANLGFWRSSRIFPRYKLSDNYLRWFPVVLCYLQPKNFQRKQNWS